MEFKSLCQQCPIQKMCTLPCKIFEVDKCDTYDYAVAQKIYNDWAEFVQSSNFITFDEWLDKKCLNSENQNCA